MGSDNEAGSSLSKIPILAYDNSDFWFYSVKQLLTAKGLFHVIEELKISAVSSTASDAATPSTDSVDGLAKRLQSFSFDPSSPQFDTKSNAQATFKIISRINEDDQEMAMEKNTAKEIWDALKNKYTKKLPTTSREDIRKFVAYKMKPDQTIENAWTDLRKLSKRIIAAQPQMAHFATIEGRLQQLLASLPDSYSSTRDTIDAQSTLDVDQAIHKLREKEAQLKESSETALWANKEKSSRNDRSRDRRHQSKSRRHRSSSSSGSDFTRSKKKVECLGCGGRHFVRDCTDPMWLEYQKKLRARKRSSKEFKNRKQTHRSKHRAYNAEDNSQLSFTESDESEESEEETCALSKEEVSNAPRDLWIADTGASSPMTDNLRLFSGSLRPIRRRTIKVGGGKLYSDQCGTAMMRAADGSYTPLSSVLYVPNLGVNLLSVRRLCEHGLQGSFDKKGLYLHDYQGRRVLKAPVRQGVYIVEKLATDVNDFALISVYCRHKALPAEEIFSDSDIADHSHKVDTDTVSSGKALETYKLWHRRFAHLGEAKLRNLHKVTTLAKPIPIAKNHASVCEVCALTKLTNKRGHTVSPRKPEILALLSIDICGALPTSREGYRYFLEIVDNHSRRTWLLMLKTKGEAIESLRKWRLETELATGARVKAVRSDNAPELKTTLDEWCSSIGIAPQYTISYMSTQNGVAERGIRTIENSVRAMLKDAELPLEFWPEAAQADVYLRNRVATGPMIDGNPTAPIEAFTGVKPSIDHIRVWGCKCYSYVDPRSIPSGDKSGKLTDKGRRCVFLGYVEGTVKQFLMWAPDMKAVIRGHSVRFAEDEKGGSMELNLAVQTSNKLPTRKPVGRPRKTVDAPGAGDGEAAGITTTVPAADIQMMTSSQQDPAYSKVQANARARSSPDLAQDGSVNPRCSAGSEGPNDFKNAESDPDYSPPGDGKTSQTEFSDQPSYMSLRSKRTTDASRNTLSTSTKTRISPFVKKVRTLLHVATPKISKRKLDEEESDYEEQSRSSKIPRAMFAMLAETDEADGDTVEESLALMAASQPIPQSLEIPTPTTYKQAIEDPIWGELWQEAIKAQLNALRANGTWEEVVPPKDANIVTSKWVFKPKLNPDGSLDKLKARLVARGFSQAYGVDYENTFAPTARFDTLRLFLAIVALEDLECHQVDVNNAFTESFLKEVIYMSPPPGVEVAKGRALRILRSLYGLKQAARDWHEKCITELIKLGFQQCAADPCLLVNYQRGIMLLLYVDDIAIASKTVKEIQWFKSEFFKIFKVKDLGEISKILGINVTRNRAQRTLRIDQSHYLKEVLKRLHMMKADKHKRTDIPMNGYDGLRPAGPDDERIDQQSYQQAIGSLMYAAIHTRPDIAFTLGRLSQYLSDPAKHHGQALKALLRYLRSSINLGITYGASGSSGSVNLVGYSDSDYAADRSERKSILGYVYMFANGPVSWMSRKQKSVATSTTEAEYMAMSSCVKEGKWIAQMLRDLNLVKYLGDSLNRIEIKENQKHQSTSPTQLVPVQHLADNQAAITLVKDAHIHERSKHIDVAYHHVRDLYKRNLIRVDFIPSKDCYADGFTKPLPKDAFQRFVKQLGLKDSGS